MAPPRPPKKPTHPNPILQSLLRLEFMQHADPDEATRLNLQAIDDFRAFSEIVRTRRAEPSSHLGWSFPQPTTTTRWRS